LATRTVSVVLRAEIDQYMAGMTRAAGATSGLGSTVDRTSRQTRNGFDLAGKGALLLGGTVATGIGMAVSASMKFEQSMSAVQAATQASAGTMDSLRDAAMRAGADTQYSATEAADAITEMAKAGVSAKDIMGGGLSGALALAAAGQIDVAEAAGIASVAMQQFSLDGSDLPHVADLLAAGAGKAMGSVDDLGQALNQAGLIASAAGLSIEETTGGLAAFASAGLIGSDAGTSFKTMLQALQAPSGKSAELMQSLGLNMYDANGNMLGLSEMAGQLQSQLGGLTEEQRNSALATIFGSDAVRAANVLYKEGAAGITDWTAKVNDAGYAQEQAAALTDNLKGDLERLGGAWDTLLINFGSGAQGPLREVVQAFTGILDVATGVLDFWSNLPGPVQAGVVALGAVALLKGPVSSAMETIALRAMYAADALTGPNSLRSAGAGLVSFFGGPWGLAVAGAAVGLTALVSWLNASSDASKEAESAQADLVAALEASNGAIDDNVRAAAAKSAQDAGLLDMAEALGLSLPLVTDAVLGNKDAYDQLVGAANSYYDTALLSKNAGDLGMTENADKVRGFIDGLNVLAPTVDQNRQQQEALATATAATGGTMADATVEVRSFKDEAADAKKVVDDLKAGLDALTGTTVSQFEAQAQLEDAIATADGALKDMTGSVLDADGKLNAYSESGRAAGGVLLEVRDKGNQLISTLQAQGATADEVREADGRLRQSFIDTAQRMGIGSDAANQLADDILGIPSERLTRIDADTSAASRNISDLQRQIDNIARDRSASINFRATLPDLNGAASGSGRPGLASGGYTGPGGKYDPAPYQVHRGEIVFSQADIAAHGGVQAVESMRRSRPLSYAEGGIIDLESYANTSGAVSGLDSFTRQLDAAVSKATASLSAMAGGSLGGATPGSWMSLFNQVHALIPQARVNSAFRPGDPGAHGRNKAVDFGFGVGPGGLGSPGLASINRLLHDRFGGQLYELIYDGRGDDRDDLKNGRPHTYNVQTQREHTNHVHAAVYHDGTDYVPQTGWAYLERGEAVIPAAANPRSREVSGGFGSGGRSVVQVTSGPVKVYLDGQEWRSMARVEAEQVVDQAFGAQADAVHYAGGA
jgi:TP901 family phage tail tape measure protein